MRPIMIVTVYGPVPATLAIVIGLSLVIAGIGKISSGTFAEVVLSWEVFPAQVAKAFGKLLPVGEIALGSAVVLSTLSGNVFLRFALGGSSLLLALFLVGQLDLLRRGVLAPCGCFGGGHRTIGGQTLIRTATWFMTAVTALYLAL